MGLRTGVPSEHWSFSLMRKQKGSLFARLRTRTQATFLLAYSRFAKIVTRCIELPAPRLLITKFVRHEADQYTAHFEQLVDLLCAAARDGMVGEREAEYSNLVNWMVRHKPSALSSHFVTRVDWCAVNVDLHELLGFSSLSEAISRVDTIALIVQLRESISIWQSV